MNLIEKGFKFNNFDAMKITAQHDLDGYYQSIRVVNLVASKF